jgi:hypothetical protein
MGCNKLDDGAGGRLSVREAVKAERRDIDAGRVAAPQPAGGGVAQETWVKCATAGNESLLGDVRPMIPALLTQTRPAAVIVSPYKLLSGLLPGGLPHARLAAVRSRLHLIGIQNARR